MKVTVRLVTIFMISACCVHIPLVSTPQPVVAYKTVEKTKPWTIGIYDQNGNLLPGTEQIVFRSNTEFMSGKGKKLFFNFGEDGTQPNVVRVHKFDAVQGTKKLASLTSGEPELPLQSEPINQKMAPPGSKIKITATDITIEKPKAKTIAIYTTTDADGLMPLTITSSKIDDQQIVYGKPIVIQKNIPGKIYQLTVPTNEGFHITLQQNNQKLLEQPIYARDIKPDSELVVGNKTVSIIAKQNRKDILAETAVVNIPLKKVCNDVLNPDCDKPWTVEIYNTNNQHTGFTKKLSLKPELVRVPVNSPFVVHVTMKQGEDPVESVILHEKGKPLTKNNVMLIYENGNAIVTTKGSQLDIVKGHGAESLRAQEQHGGL